MGNNLIKLLRKRQRKTVKIERGVQERREKEKVNRGSLKTQKQRTKLAQFQVDKTL